MEAFRKTLDAVDAVRDAQVLESIARCLGWNDSRVILAAAAIIQASHGIDSCIQDN